MYSSRRKSKRSYRKRVVSRKNKTRSKRKNLKFRKMRGGGLTLVEIQKILQEKQPELADYVGNLTHILDKTSVEKTFEHVKDETDSDKLNEAIGLLNKKMLFDRDLAKRMSLPKQHFNPVSVSEQKSHLDDYLTSRAAAAPTHSTPTKYLLDLNDDIFYPVNSDKNYIVFEQNIDRKGLVENRVRRLNRVVNTDNPEIHYYVITDMEQNSLNPLPKDLYEKIGEPDIVKKVGSYNGITTSNITGITID